MVDIIIYTPELESEISSINHTTRAHFLSYFSLFYLKSAKARRIGKLYFRVSIIEELSYIHQTLSTHYLSSYHPILLSFYLSSHIFLSSSPPIFLPSSLPIFLSSYHSLFLSSYLPIFPSSYLPPFLPIFLSSYHSPFLSSSLPPFLSYSIFPYLCHLNYLANYERK